MSDLPPCGLYRTTRAFPQGGPAAGRLVYFHNHGSPGPGLYLPQSWKLNRVQWHSHGTTLPDASWASSLEPLPAEGFYRVRESFFCCAKRCREFSTDLLVQLGYNDQAQAILFVPEWTTSGLAIPESGSAVDADRLAKLSALRVASSAQSPEAGVPAH